MSLALSSDLPERAGPLVNMRELAVRLRTSRQTLSVWLDKWTDFPIVTRGTNGREYEFDAAAVFAFLRAKQDEQARSTAERDQALAQLALPFELELEDEARAPGRLSLKDQLDGIKLRKLQREEAERSGRLVEAAEVSHMLTTCFVQWNRALHAALRTAGREHNLPDPVLRALDARLADTQRLFVQDATALLAGLAA